MKSKNGKSAYVGGNAHINELEPGVCQQNVVGIESANAKAPSANYNSDAKDARFQI